MTTNIYILQLEQGKYYVGKASDVLKRYKDHQNGTGAAWTSLYKPISIINVITGARDFDEDRYVKEYMNTYSIDNVRGGSYVTHVLSDVDKKVITRELRAAMNCCTRCGRNNHFVKDCYAKKDVDNHIIVDDNNNDQSQTTLSLLSYV